MSNMRTIRVTGKGQIKVKPDTTRITISLDTVVVYLVALHEMHFRWNNTTEEELPPLVSFFITGGDSEDD